MKTLNHFLFIVFILVLTACSGSETYRGTWKAMNGKGEKFDITFYEHHFSIKTATGDSTSYAYSQHSIKIENHVETYGIQLDDGRKYQIQFPLIAGESTGIMTDGYNNLQYTIARQDYVKYDEMYELK